MNNYYIYSQKLQDYIISSKYIPRKIHKNEHLKLFHKYWFNRFDNSAKVEDMYLIGTREYYTIRYDKTMYACISFPIEIDSCYELLHNKEGIENYNIINSSISYSGAEIKYWFVYNKIDFSDNKYYGFWSFLNPKSDNVLVDNKYYFVSYDTKRRQKFQMILDKSKL